MEVKLEADEMVGVKKEPEENPSPSVLVEPYFAIPKIKTEGESNYLMESVVLKTIKEEPTLGILDETEAGRGLKLFTCYHCGRRWISFVKLRQHIKRRHTSLSKRNAAKQKWKNLHDSYMSYMKSTKGVTGQAKKYEKLPWCGHMAFLDDTLSFRSQTSNISQSSTEIEDTSPPTSVTPPLM